MILLEGSSSLTKILGGSFQGKTSRLMISSSLLCWRVNDIYFIPEYVYSWQSSRELQAQHIRCWESTEDKRWLVVVLNRPRGGHHLCDKY